MNEEAGQPQSNAPGQYSPDRRWQWDGHEWKPAQQAPSQREYPSPPAYAGHVETPLAAPDVTPPPLAPARSPNLLSDLRPTLPTARWALGLGIATVLAFVIGLLTAGIRGDLASAVGNLTFVLVVMLGVLALVFGIRSQRQIVRSAEAWRGREMAIAGWICGLCGLAMVLLELILTFVPG